MTRGTGRTTKQMKEAPQNAVFIWGTPGSIEYAVDLARKIGREDLQIKTPVWLKDQWKGLRLTGVVVDHAAPLSSEQAEGLQKARIRLDAK